MRYMIDFMLRLLRNTTVAWVLAQAAANGEDSKIASFHTDPVEVWGSRFLIITIFVGIALLLFNLFKFRGTTAGPFSWALLTAGIILVPLMATGLGTLLVFDRAERVEFCASCHLTMQTFVDDMRDPKSESLAAVHFKNKYIPDNQCYVCHTSYGMFGTVEAKIEPIPSPFPCASRIRTTIASSATWSPLNGSSTMSMSRPATICSPIR